MKDFSNGIRSLTKLFLFCFVGLMLYMTYFSVFRGIGISNKEGNPRILIERNKTLRGKIYDINGEVLAESKRDEDGFQKRDYLYGEVYGAIIGYESIKYGNTGLEKICDEYLVNSSNGFNIDLDFKNYFENKKLDRIGNGVITTLDNEMQNITYEAMQNQGFEGGVVVMNPKNGHIISMVTTPTYDANDIENVMKIVNSGEAPDKYLYNRTIDVTYPPGSVFKTLTMAVALEKEPAIKNRTFNDKGTIEFADGSTLSNHDFKANGMIDLQMAYRLSSNYVFGTLGMEIPNYYFADKAEDFGFNEEIRGIGVTAVPSNFPRIDDEFLGERAQSGIGQGQVSVTPLQMAMIVSGTVNDGVLMKPKLINSIIDKDGNEIKVFEDEVLKDNVVTEETSMEVRANMKALVDGAQYSYAYPTFAEFIGTNAGGKTGTADYWVDGNTLGIPYAWFVAAAPMDDPEIVVAVVCEEGKSGSGPSAAIAARIINRYVNR